jgi:hypothetical protein
VLERVQLGNQRQATLTYDLPQPGEKPARVLSFLTRESCGGRSGFHLWIQNCFTPSMLRNRADQFSRRCRAVETANNRPAPAVRRATIAARGRGLLFSYSLFAIRRPSAAPFRR